MIKTYKNIKTNIKKGLYTIGGGFLITALLGTNILAQEGTIEEKVNGEVSEPTNISDTIKEEQKSPEYLSNEINESFQENLANSFKIGKWSGYKETTNGIDNYIVEGLGIFSKCEIESDGPPNYVTIANYAISKGFDGAVSALKYGPLDRDFCIKSRENKGNGIWIIYFKKIEKNTKSSTQDKEE